MLPSFATNPYLFSLYILQLSQVFVFIILTIRHLSLKMHINQNISLKVLIVYYKQI